MLRCYKLEVLICFSFPVRFIRNLLKNNFFERRQIFISRIRKTPRAVPVYNFRRQWKNEWSIDSPEKTIVLSAIISASYSRWWTIVHPRTTRVFATKLLLKKREIYPRYEWLTRGESHCAERIGKFINTRRRWDGYAQVCSEIKGCGRAGRGMAAGVDTRTRSRDGWGGGRYPRGYK